MVVLNYFRSIFASTNPTPEAVDEVSKVRGTPSHHAMNESLTQHFTSEEVFHALKQMHPLKSPGPDGMSPSFFQKYWSIVGTDVCATVLDFLNNGSLDPLINFTHIVLIPKCPSPSDMSQFRPISLCNVIYKFASKVLANRVKPLLDAIVSPSQAAFVLGRLITDNVLVAYELNQLLKLKTKGKHGFMSLKLDVSKAYDRVEWSFLERVLLRLGFHQRFVSLVMMCVTSVSFSFLLNGHSFVFSSRNEDPSRGSFVSVSFSLVCRSL
ncbi:UNVERIFIED_CONTAM: LINE-1 retrotransposable element O protein [Sesamum radiatum]|uniref:LINE-1 retrotransposable element O protein n=1 Tax=Sesamum radiatum TaxID=300843 RepID=A0AAW2IQ38_SESRA